MLHIKKWWKLALLFLFKVKNTKLLTDGARPGTKTYCNRGPEYEALKGTFVIKKNKVIPYLE